jgi:hypothetical protein
VHTGFSGKPEGRRPVVRPSYIWEDNIKMNLKKVKWWGAQTGWIWLRIGRGGELF